MAVVNLVAPEINAEYPFSSSPGSIGVEATLSGSDSTPQDWSLLASSFTSPSGNPIDQQTMTYSSGSASFTATVSIGAIPTGKPTDNNLMIRVEATKNTGGSGLVEAQCKAWVEDSSSSSDSKAGTTAKSKAKGASPAMVLKAKATMAKAAPAKAAPAKAAKKAPPKKPAAKPKKTKK